MKTVFLRHSRVWGSTLLELQYSKIYSEQTSSPPFQHSPHPILGTLKMLWQEVFRDALKSPKVVVKEGMSLHATA